MSDARRDRPSLLFWLLLLAAPAGPLAAQSVSPLTSTTTLSPLSGKVSGFVAPLPDLVITDVSLDSNCRVLVSVANQGTGPLPDTVWTEQTPSSSSLYLRQAAASSGGGITLWKLDPGRQLQRPGGSARWYSGLVISATQQLDASVDHTAAVNESNESNNSKRVTLTCADSATLAPLPQQRDATPVTAMLDTGHPRPDTEAPAAPRDAAGAPATATASTATPRSQGSLLGTPLPALPATRQAPSPARPDDREPGELLVVSGGLADANLLAQQARQLGFTVLSRNVLSELGMVVTRLRLPATLDADAALQRLQQWLPDVRGDANHRYAPLAPAPGTPLTQTGWHTTPACGDGVRIGQADTAIDPAHVARARIVERNFLPAGVTPADTLHGSANASLLLGAEDPGLLPASTLFNAAVFRQRDRKRRDTDAMTLVQALDWLASRQVDAIGLSLGGPYNRILDTAISRLLQRGIPVVAAGGNDGANGEPVWPAAQPGVVAVTAVDQDGRLYKRATRGDYIDFAAPGVDLRVPDGHGKSTYVSGTSHAVPFVLAAVAMLRHQYPDAEPATLTGHLAEQAQDIAPPGRDPQTGWGLLRHPGCPTN